MNFSNDAAVTGDDGPGELEVAGEELPYLLGISSLREGREADEVAEQHRDVAGFGASSGCGVGGQALNRLTGAGAGARTRL